MVGINCGEGINQVSVLGLVNICLNWVVKGLCSTVNNVETSKPVLTLDSLGLVLGQIYVLNKSYFSPLKFLSLFELDY
jgi:hypothetical protein